MSPLAPAAAADTLAAQAQLSGRFFGTAVAWSPLQQADNAALIAREFDSLAAENEMAWDATEPSRGVFNVTRADAIVNFGLDHGMKIRGRSLVWHAGLPGWLVGLQGDALRTAYTRHITTLVDHWKGKISSWDVVNEAFSDTGTLRPTLFRSQLGDGYIEEAFRTARAADPQAKLCYNDYFIEDWASPKTQAVYAMVKDFTARGVPIDCVGFESHFLRTAPVPATFRQTLAAFADLGVDVQLTELDSIGDATQPDQYSKAVGACVAVPRCTGITVFGTSDKFSWRSPEQPLLFDANYAKKPAYDAVMDALLVGLPTTTTTTTTEPTTTTTTTEPTTTTTTTTTVPTTTTTTTTVPPTTTTTAPPRPTCTAAIRVLGAWRGGWYGLVEVTAGPAGTTRWSTRWTFPRGTDLTAAWGAIVSGSRDVVATSTVANGRLQPGGGTSWVFLARGPRSAPPVTCTAS